MEGKKTQDKLRWVNSPNVYQKVEVLETGTSDPKKITKVWYNSNYSRIFWEHKVIIESLLFYQYYNYIGDKCKELLFFLICMKCLKYNNIFL